MTNDDWDEILKAAIDWQYLIVLHGGMARKSDCEAWLMPRFGIDDFMARQVTNYITEAPRCFVCSRDGVEWREGTAMRAAPKPEDYPDIDYSVGRL